MNEFLSTILLNPFRVLRSFRFHPRVAIADIQLSKKANQHFPSDPQKSIRHHGLASSALRQ